MKNKICVIAEPLTSINPDIIEHCEALGESLAKNKRHIITTGFDSGVLTFFLKSFRANKGQLSTIYCSQFSALTTIFEHAEAVQIVDDFDVQKKELIHSADAFIVLPDHSLFCLQFICDILYRNSLNLITKPIGIYDSKENFLRLKKLISHYVENMPSPFLMDRHFVNDFNPWALINKLDYPGLSYEK